MKMRITRYLQVRCIPFLLSHLMKFSSEILIRKETHGLQIFFLDHGFESEFKLITLIPVDSSHTEFK